MPNFLFNNVAGQLNVYCSLTSLLTMKVFNICSRWGALLLIIHHSSKSLYKACHWEDWDLEEGCYSNSKYSLWIHFGSDSAVRIELFPRKKSYTEDRRFSEIQWDNSFPQQKTTKKFDRINFPTKVLKNILSLYPCFHTSIRQGICAEGDLQPIRRLGCWLQPGSQESDPQKSFCKWHQYGISIQSSTKLRETFRQITPKLWATKTWDWDKYYCLYISLL